MRHVDLCSGIGGFALGFEWAGLSKPVLFCDIEPWSRKVLRKHWPNVPIAEDVKELALDPVKLVPDCEIITAGYPCQPFSVAGDRRGHEDDRHIWPEIFSIIQAKRPSWCVFENVYGHVSMGLDHVLSDLEGEGYAARPFIVPACAVDAPHRRDRVWIIARDVADATSPRVQAWKCDGMGNDHGPCGHQIQSEGGGSKEHVGDANSQQRKSTKKDREMDVDRDILDRRQRQKEADTTDRSGGDVADANSERLQGQWRKPELVSERKTEQTTWRSSKENRARKVWLPEPPVGRVANGIPRRVDRLRGLGNAIVPQIAQRIGESIKLSMQEGSKINDQTSS